MSDVLDTDTDPALAAAVLEIDAHVAGEGWGQPARLYALVDTATLVAREPVLARMMGLDAANAAGSMTPVEQEGLVGGELLEEALPAIIWPDGVTGAAAVVERWVLPPGTELPEGAGEEYAATHLERQRVRMVAGATRAGASYCALRLRADDTEVVGGADLVPELVQLLHASLEDEHTDE